MSPDMALAEFIDRCLRLFATDGRYRRQLVAEGTPYDLRKPMLPRGLAA